MWSSGHTVGSSEGEGRALQDGFPTPPGHPSNTPVRVRKAKGYETELAPEVHIRRTEPIQPKDLPFTTPRRRDSARK